MIDHHYPSSSLSKPFLELVTLMSFPPWFAFHPLVSLHWILWMCWDVPLVSVTGPSSDLVGRIFVHWIPLVSWGRHISRPQRSWHRLELRPLAIAAGRHLWLLVTTPKVGCSTMRILRSFWHSTHEDTLICWCKGWIQHHSRKDPFLLLWYVMAWACLFTIAPWDRTKFSMLQTKPIIFAGPLAYGQICRWLTHRFDTVLDSL